MSDYGSRLHFNGAFFTARFESSGRAGLAPRGPWRDRRSPVIFGAPLRRVAARRIE